MKLHVSKREKIHLEMKWHGSSMVQANRIIPRRCVLRTLVEGSLYTAVRRILTRGRSFTTSAYSAIARALCIETAKGLG